MKNEPQTTIETLKPHYPTLSRIFDQIAKTKAYEAEYRNKYREKLNGNSSTLTTA